MAVGLSFDSACQQGAQGKSPIPRWLTRPWARAACNWALWNSRRTSFSRGSLCKITIAVLSSGGRLQPGDRRRPRQCRAASGAGEASTPKQPLRFGGPRVRAVFGNHRPAGGRRRKSPGELQTPVADHQIPQRQSGRGPDEHRQGDREQNSGRPARGVRQTERLRAVGFEASGKCGRSQKPNPILSMFRASLQLEAGQIEEAYQTLGRTRRRDERAIQARCNRRRDTI